MERILTLIIGYLIGSIIQAGYWLTRFHHIDIKSVGSGNAGTTNVSRALGKKYGFLTYLIDALKVSLSAVISYLIFGKGDIAALTLFMYSGLGVVLGHNFPFYLKFQGGKGIAATSGIAFSLLLFPKHCWVFTVLGFLTFSLVSLGTKYVSLGSLIFISTFLIEFIIWGFIGWLPLSGFALYEAYAIMAVMTILGFFKHRGNIKRLIDGKERKIGQKKEQEVNNG